VKAKQISRRQFLGTAASAAAFVFVPRHVLGGPRYVAPSEKLNIACIGIGGMGASDVSQFSSENIVALCDVDWKHAAGTFKAHPEAKKYRDFRVRRLTMAAREHGVMTQMGTQIHATNEMKVLVEIIRSGLIGNVRKVDLWSGKNWGGGTRPTDTPPVPETLDWDLWLGPAPYRPYHPTYLPGQWRRWWDFGTGTLGDMGCHIIDPAWWALDLDYPTSIEAKPGPFSDETYPTKTVITWEFPARGNRPPVTVRWYDGDNRPPRPPQLEEGRNLPGQGGVYYGDKGTILYPHMGGPRLIPESSMKGFKKPEAFLPRGKGGASWHYKEWVQACKGGPKPLSNFDYAGPLTEAILLGNIAAKAGRKILWDGPAMKVTNMPEINEHLRRQYREGWVL